MKRWNPSSILFVSINGSILWKTSIGESWIDSGLYPGSRSTPTVDGDRIYAYGTEGTLA